MNTLNRDHMTFIKVGPLNTATSVFSLNSARRVSEFSVPLCYSVSDTVKAGEYHKTWLETKTEMLYCIEENSRQEHLKPTGFTLQCMIYKLHD